MLVQVVVSFLGLNKTKQKTRALNVHIKSESKGDEAKAKSNRKTEKPTILNAFIDFNIKFSFSVNKQQS